MPYAFVKPTSDARTDVSAVQQELDAWRLHMRAERQRRLRASALRQAGRARTERDASRPLSRAGSDVGSATPPTPVCALRAYRRELHETARALGGRLRGVTYCEARSALRDYIRRPVSIRRPQRTASGGLRAYRDAIAPPPADIAAWHQQPLRRVHAERRRAERTAQTVAPTRAALLRQREAKGRGGGGGGERRALEPTAAYAEAVGRLSSRRAESPKRQRSATQPMSAPTPMEASPKPRAPFGPDEWAVSPPTPHEARRERADGKSGREERERPPTRVEGAPLLADLLSRLSIPSPSIYRPDLFQGAPENGPEARHVRPIPQPRPTQ